MIELEQGRKLKSQKIGEKNIYWKTKDSQKTMI